MNQVKTIRICFLLLLLSLPALPLKAQETALRYVDVADMSLYGREEKLAGEGFLRFGQSDLAELPERVQELSQNTAGLYLDFKSDSKKIGLRWELDQYRDLKNMTPIAVNGFDLYGYRDGQWQFVASARPEGKENAAVLVKNLEGHFQNYRLYFPLYTGVEEVALGIEQDAALLPADSALVPEKRVVIYGSSITQGASASRPGMAFPSILSRKLGAEFLNYGFSGSGKMELEVAQILKNVETDLFILDCVPNPSPEQIAARTVPFVLELRKSQPDTPILMVESVFRENAHWDSNLRRKVEAQNRAFREAFLQLKQQGHENLFYVDSEGHIGKDHEGTIDGSHFTDLGHFRMAEKLLPVIEEILSK